MAQNKNKTLQNISNEHIHAQEEPLIATPSAADAEDEATALVQNSMSTDSASAEAESQPDDIALVQQNVEPHDFTLPSHARIAHRLDELPKYFKQNGFVFIRDGLTFPDPNNIYVWFEPINLPHEVEVVEAYYINTMALEGRGLTVAPHSPLTKGFARQSSI
jgi:hypothetical protein